MTRGGENTATWPHVARQVQMFSNLAGRYSQNSRVKCREWVYFTKRLLYKIKLLALQADFSTLKGKGYQSDITLEWYQRSILEVHEGRYWHSHFQTNSVSQSRVLTWTSTETNRHVLSDAGRYCNFFNRQVYLPDILFSVVNACLLMQIPACEKLGSNTHLLIFSWIDFHTGRHNN